MNLRTSVHSLAVAGLMVNASHEDMDEHADFARTRAAHPTVGPYFATSQGWIGVERPADLLLRYARREFYGSSSVALWTRRLGAEKPNTRFTDGVSSYSDFRAIFEYRCEEESVSRLSGVHVIQQCKPKTVKRGRRNGAFPTEYFKEG